MLTRYALRSLGIENFSITDVLLPALRRSLFQKCPTEFNHIAQA